ncbi:hypothetical protein D4764_02G0003460 [Takifugu flavidus]|uniref:Uncharacterized protein n=1 Tax=Takifugu flavidus TaxID=433684 RepID=A0A5C6NK35_9TELE|nr:hypothetical protein D4764_02G0003460 [Takifugu flavidus]
MFRPEPLRDRLDHMSILDGCPNNSLRSLQLIQNAAARVLTGIDKRDHITPVMASLHWLPVKFRTNRSALRMLVYLWFPEFLGVEWGAEHLATRPPCYGTSSLSRYRRLSELHDDLRPR